MTDPTSAPAGLRDEPMRIGVVVPAYQAGGYIDSLFESLTLQSHGQWRAVVIDDGSDDDTPDRIRRWAARDDRIRGWRIPNSGPSVARNLGYRLLGSEVDLVTFMDADDRYLPDAFALLVAASEDCESSQSSGLPLIGAHGLGEFIDHEGCRIEPGRFSELGRGRRRAHRFGVTDVPIDERTDFGTAISSSTVFPPGLMLVRREAYEAIRNGPNVFDTARVKAEDWDVLIRLCRVGDLKLVPEVLLEYRRHATNLGASAGVGAACTAMLKAAYRHPQNVAHHHRALRAAHRARHAGAMKSRWTQAQSGKVAVRLDRLLRAGIAFARALWGRPGRSRPARRPPPTAEIFEQKLKEAKELF